MSKTRFTLRELGYYALPACIDQREVQSLGGDCVTHPYSCYLKLVADVLGLTDCTWLDLTFGVGLFYAAWRPKYLIGLDIVDWRERGYRWFVQPDEFYRVDIRDVDRVLELVGSREVDVVVFDPPYPVEPRKRIATSRPWLYHCVGKFEELVQAFTEIAFKVAKRAALMKFHDSRNYKVTDVVQMVGRRPDLILIYRNISRKRPSDNVKIILNFSYLLVWLL